jgi:hypothetical protein
MAHALWRMVAYTLDAIEIFHRPVKFKNNGIGYTGHEKPQVIKTEMQRQLENVYEYGFFYSSGFSTSLYSKSSLQTLSITRFFLPIVGGV